jgi:ribokinase
MNPPQTQKEQKKTLVIGSINLDFFFYVDQFPKPGETIMGKTFKTFSGGKGFNQAFYINQIYPNQTRFLAFIGNDSNGEFLKKKYNENNFEKDDLVVLKDYQSGCAFITVNNQGENSIIVNSGSNMQIQPEMIINRKEIFAKRDFIVSQCEIPLKIISQSFKISKEVNPNVKNVLNLSPVPEKDFLFILENVDILVVNEAEFSKICAKAKLENFGEIAKKFKIQYIICTRGSNSVLIYDNEKNLKREIPSIKVEKIIDTCGAGDSFLGGMMVGLMKGYGIYESIGMGNRVASRKIQFQSAQVEFEDLGFLERNEG